MNEWRTDKPKENGSYLVTICFTAGGQIGNRLAILAYGTPENPNEEVDGKCWYLPSEENDGVYDIVYADTEISAWQELPKVYEADDQESEYIDREQFRKALIHYTQTFKDKYTIQDPSKLFDYLRGLGRLLNRTPTADVVDRAKFKQLLENSTIMADALKEYENEDLVEVVRCEDCYWGKEVSGNIECNEDLNYPKYHGYDWYCPNGERG